VFHELQLGFIKEWEGSMVVLKKHMPSTKDVISSLMKEK
jgi:hypothetical protein